MKESKDTKKTRNITFRLTDEEYSQVEQAAGTSGYDPNTWCRKAAIDKSSERFALTKNEHLLYQEIALLRFLVGHGFKMLFGSDDTTASAWKKVTNQADQRTEVIVAELLSRRR